MSLKRLNLPKDIKGLTYDQCNKLCKDIRTILIDTVSKNGGHLASNLGTVELTVAIHRVFNSPKDKIVWDVGHQAYTHKLLTGRYKDFNTLRKEGGISGFPKPSESEHDAFISGHSSTSISLACGMAQVMKLRNQDDYAVAVIGDGAFTGGLAYEGLNNGGNSDLNLIIILNQNDMSISENTGAIANYFSKIRQSESYANTKLAVKKTLDKVPLGKNISNVISRSKGAVKGALFNNNIF
ncbi:MAG: 1-deoxy-D-xylulose-5-phosphate synthase, partial [Ruminococcus sp.]|nr:1-deoxy-D-xylulose-5-phosphate synthase [Ruminococcus sp.]